MTLSKAQLPDLKRLDLTLDHLALLSNLKELSTLDKADAGSLFHLNFSNIDSDYLRDKHASTIGRHRRLGWEFLTEIRNAAKNSENSEVQKQLLTRSAVKFMLEDKNVVFSKQLKLHLLAKSLQADYIREDEEAARQLQRPPIIIHQGASGILSDLQRDDNDDYDIHRRAEEYISQFQQGEVVFASTSSAGSTDDQIDFSTSEFCSSYLGSSHVSEELRQAFEEDQQDILLNEILPGGLGQVQLSTEQLSILAR